MKTTRLVLLFSLLFFLLFCCDREAMYSQIPEQSNTNAKEKKKRRKKKRTRKKENERRQTRIYIYNQKNDEAYSLIYLFFFFSARLQRTIEIVFISICFFRNTDIYNRIASRNRTEKIKDLYTHRIIQWAQLLLNNIVENNVNVTKLLLLVCQDTLIKV